MEGEEKKSRLEDLDERLYEKEFKERPISRGAFKKKEYGVQEQWREVPHTENRIRTLFKTTIMKRILIVSIIFFTAALGFAAYKFYMGANLVSAQNVNISIKGPVSVSGGEEFSLDIGIDNKSDAAIESAVLLIAYPEGAYAAFDSSDKLTRGRESLGTIAPSRSAAKSIPLVLFGEENSEKDITVTLEFRFQGSSATLEKTESYTVRVSSSPVNIAAAVPREVNAKQEFEIVLSLGSNSSKTMKNILLQVDYPFGFTFRSASPSASSGENIWSIGDMAPSDEREIKIRGVVEGQEGDEKIFKIYAGTREKEGKDTLGTIYGLISESTVITKSFLGVDLLIGGNQSPVYIAPSQQALRVDVPWVSNILTRIIDGEIEVRIGGTALDKYSVSPNKGGFYRSIDNVIVWDKSSSKEFDTIEPGEKGSVGFTFQSLPLASAGTVIHDPTITIEVRAKGKRISEANVPEESAVSLGKTIRIASDLALAPRSVYYVGPFKNSGPIPPKAEQETTYTIIWTVTNTSNKITGAVARATLPSYVKWLSVVSPSDERVSFNDVGGEVVWELGNVDRGVGFTSRAREVAFQVSLLPSISQIGRPPSLVGEATLSGKDSFTGTTVSDITRELSTQLSTDPYFKNIEALVER